MEITRSTYTVIVHGCECTIIIGASAEYDVDVLVHDIETEWAKEQDAIVDKS